MSLIEDLVTPVFRKPSTMSLRKKDKYLGGKSICHHVIYRQILEVIYKLHQICKTHVLLLINYNNVLFYAEFNKF